ncbi:MAG: DUF4307 domain-containing protein [Micromonosporaceae bacterium]
MPPEASAAGPEFPPGRYGRRRSPRPRRRWASISLTVAAVLFGLAITAQLYQQYGNPEHSSQVLSFTLAERHVKIRFEVRKPGGEPATCVVRARAKDGAEVGRAEVDIPAGRPDDTSVTVTYTLATSRKPVTGEVAGCGDTGG